MHQEMLAWIREKHYELINTVSSLTPLFMTTEFTSTCIICGQDMGICPFCTVFEIKQFLELGELEEDFDDIFGLRWYEFESLYPT